MLRDVADRRRRRIDCLDLEWRRPNHLLGQDIFERVQSRWLGTVVEMVLVLKVVFDF